jgi:hypothetical protein
VFVNIFSHHDPNYAVFYDGCLSIVMIIASLLDTSYKLHFMSIRHVFDNVLLLQNFVEVFNRKAEFYEVSKVSKVAPVLN